MRADRTGGVRVTLAILMSAACTASTEAPEQASEDGGPGATQTFLEVPQGF